MILIISGEPYQARQHLNQVVREHAQQGFELYKLDAQDGEEKDVERNIINLLQAQSLFAKQKIVVVTNADAKFIKQFVEKQTKQIGESTLVFLVQKQLALKSKEVVAKHFALPQGNNLTEFIKQEFAKRNFTPPYQLVSALGVRQKSFSDLYWLVNEIEKISLAPNHSQELLMKEEIASPFAITDAFAQRKKSNVLAFLEQEFYQGTQAVEILNRILWQLRVLLIVSDYKLHPPPRTSYKLPFHPFVIQKARGAAHSFSPSELSGLYLNAISLYENLLFSGLPSKLLLSQFFWQL